MMMAVQGKDLPVAEVLQAVHDSREGAAPGPVALLRERHPEWPEKVIIRKLERLTDLGLIDYGTAVTSPWLTDQGRAVLREQES